MKLIRTISYVGFFIVLKACPDGSNTSTDKTPNTLSKKSTVEVNNTGDFMIEAGALKTINEQGHKASSFNYRNDYWEFTADGVKLRMAARFENDQIGIELISHDLEYNNVYFEFIYNVSGKNTRVSCKADRDPRGYIKRYINTDQSNSGSFEIELIQCRNTYTSEKIEGIKTPFIIAGQFEQIPHKESLF